MPSTRTTRRLQIGLVVLLGISAPVIAGSFLVWIVSVALPQYP